MSRVWSLSFVERPVLLPRRKRNTALSLSEGFSGAKHDGALAATTQGTWPGLCRMLFPRVRVNAPLRCGQDDQERPKHIQAEST